MSSLFRGIGWRIFFSFSMLLIVLTLILSFLALKYVQNSATESASNEVRVLSITLSQQLQRYLKRTESGLKSLSASGGILDRELTKEKVSTNRLNTFLNSKLAQLSYFDLLAVFDDSGVCVASTDKDWIGLPAQRELFFITGLKHFSFAEIYESNEGDEKVLLASVPINEGNDPHGVMVASVRLSSLYDLLGQKLALKGNSEAFLLDHGLQFITPAKSAPENLLQSHLSTTPLVHHLQDEFWVGQYSNYKGIEVLGTVLKLPGYEWYLAVERDFIEVDQQVAEIKKALFSATLILLIGLILTTVFLTHSITKPLQTLVESAQQIAAGDFNKPVQIPRGADEISFLATEFNKMRARVAATQGKLIEQLEESEEKRSENERLAAIGTLASSLAHEIRNPLNAVSLLLSQFERSKGSDDAKSKIIDNMRSEIGRLDRLVSDILDYARPFQLQIEKFSLEKFMTEVTDFYKAVLDRNQINFQIESLAMGIEIQADKDKLRQAIVNLIQNSVEAMKGGGQLTIKIEKVEKWVRISIKDTGIGISESARGRLFDLFFTTKEQGTGLGLSTVRKIVDVHRGRIDIESVPNGGTTVIVTLPCMVS